MKIQFVLSVGVALLQATPILSAGVRYGNLAQQFDEFLEKARSNDSLKQCKKQCDRSYNKNSRAASNCRTQCDNSFNQPNYFPSGGQCKKRCTKNSDCQVGGYNPCGSCGQYVGTEMYQLCYAPNQNEEEELVATNMEEFEDIAESGDLSEEDFLEHNGGGGYSCGQHCHKDSDCWQGGVVTCGTCNQVHGTEGFHTCIDTTTPVTTPAPAPYNYFPEGGQCSKSCKQDSDCQLGGFNPCGSCGKYVGTLMYERCYAPPSFDEEEIAAALDALENISD